MFNVVLINWVGHFVLTVNSSGTEGLNYIFFCVTDLVVDLSRIRLGDMLICQKGLGLKGSSCQLEDLVYWFMMLDMRRIRIVQCDQLIWIYIFWNLITVSWIRIQYIIPKNRYCKSNVQHLLGVGINTPKGKGGGCTLSGIV